MDSRQISYFRAVVDHGSFTHAADALGMTQPSLSLSIRKLENELKVQLLSRGRAGVATTEAGDYLYKVSIKMDTLLTEAKQRIHEIAGGLAGSISICAAPEFNWEFMPHVISRTLQHAPEVEIHLEDPEPGITLERVLDGSIDIGLMPSTDPEAFAQIYKDELDCHVAAEWPFYVALPPRLAHMQSPVSLSDLQHETWILPPKNPSFIGLPELLSQVWHSNPQSTPSHVQTISTLQTAIPLVAGGVGIGFLPESALHLVNHNIAMRDIKEDFPPMQAVLIYRKDKDLSPATKHLVETIIQVGQETSTAHISPESHDNVESK